MKKIVMLLVLVCGFYTANQANGQKAGGTSFTFPEGKNAWSDTLYKQVQTKQMLKDSLQPITLALRLRFIKSLADGFMYELEVTNTSKEQKVKFKVNSKNTAEGFTIRLDPKETKVYQKMHLTSKPVGTARTSQKESDIFFDLPIEELMHNRD